ncbi:hypothetical protein HDU83_005840 [Entophlyctis luteolus]|nr:hypothetical protein HDU83_005840 [Entophlyctis luteolus]
MNEKHVAVLTRTTKRTTNETTRISACGVKTVTRVSRTERSTSVAYATRKLDGQTVTGRAPVPAHESVVESVVSAASALSAVPGRTYRVVRSAPVPITTRCRISNLLLTDQYMAEFSYILGTIDASDEDDNGEFIDTLKEYLGSKTVVTVSPNDQCLLASQFADSLLIVKSRLESMPQTYLKSQTIVAARLFALYLGFITRMLKNCDCFSYSAIREKILTDVLGVVFPMLFADDYRDLSEHVIGSVIFKSLQTLLAAASRPENMFAHVASYSRLSASHVWGFGGSLVSGNEDAVVLEWPEGGRRSVSLRLLQKGGRATESFRKWRNSCFPDCESFKGEAWLDSLEVNQADQIFKGRQVGFMWKNYQDAFVLFVPTKNASAASDVFQSLEEEKPWTRAWIRQELVFSAEFSISVPGFYFPLPIEIACALALLEDGASLKRSDYWTLCLARSFAFRAPNAPLPLTTIMNGAEAYYQQDHILAAMNIIKAPLTVEDPYGMSFEQLLRELLFSEARNKVISRVLACGASEDSSMFKFSFGFINAPIFDSLNFELGQINPSNDPNTFRIHFSKVVAYAEYKSLLGAFERTEKISDVLTTDSKTRYIKPQYSNQMMDSADRIGRFFNSSLFVCSEDLDQQPQVIRLASKHLVLAYAHCFKYTPSEKAVVGYLGKTSPFVLFSSKEPDSVHVWSILECVGDQIYVPIGVLASAVDLVSSDDGLEVFVTSI